MSGQGSDTDALNGGLADGVLVAERIAIARLGAEVLTVQHGNAGCSLILLPRQLHGAAPHFSRVAENADSDVNPPAAERLVPVLGIVLAAVKKDVGTSRHSCPKRLRKTLKGLFRHTFRRQPGVPVATAIQASKLFQQSAAEATCGASLRRNSRPLGASSMWSRTCVP